MVAAQAAQEVFLNTLSSENKVKVTAAFLLVLLLGLFHSFNPEILPQLWHIVTNGNMTETIEYINSFGTAAIVFSFFLDVLINAVGFLPSVFVSTANGVLFGVFVGILVSWLAETVGVILSFLLMRSILRETAQKLIAKSKYLTKLDDLSGRKGFQIMLVIRMLPYFPSGIITALGAVSKIQLRDYILANLLGKFPSTALEVVIGYELVTKQRDSRHFILVAVLALFILAGVWWYKKHGRKNESLK